MTRILLLLSIILTPVFCYAQCEENEVEITIQISTDAWGYENYWQLQPEGVGCGEDALIEGGNIVQVGCAGTAGTGGNGYANFATIEIDPICLTIDLVYTIHFIDSYGDGGSLFEVFQDGIQTGYYQGTGDGNDFTFTAGDLTPAFIDGDRPCESLEIIENGESLIFDTSEATVSPGEVEPEEYTCAAYGSWCPSNGGPSNTMWISFTPETDGAYEISTCNDENAFDTAVAVYGADDCSDFETYTLISANDDSYVGCSSGSTGFASTCYVSCLTPGEEYFIQVDGWAGANGVTELTVSSYDQAPSLNALIRNIQCANVKGDTGSRIIPQVNGLGINYDVVWSGPNDFSSTDRVIFDLAGGDYTCTVTNDCGVSLTEVFTINSPTPVVSEFSVTNTTCVGAGDGSIQISSSGGEGPYEYLWSAENDFLEQGEVISDLTEGTYFVEITDDNNCEYSSVVTLESDNALEFSLGDDQTICLDETVVLEGPTGFLVYEWQDGSENSTFIVDGSLGQGSYSINLTVTNSIGCEHTDVVNIIVDDCLGISDIKMEELEIYPNPVSDVLYLNLEERFISRFSGENLSLIVTDLQGRLVLSEPLSSVNNEIRLGGLTSGMYMVQIGFDNELSQPIQIIKK